MSTSNRIGRNPFEKANKPSRAVVTEKAVKAEKSLAAENPLAADKSKKVLKTSNKKAKQDSQLAFSIQETAAASDKEEQIIGELIELPEESWQPLTAAPAGFIKQLFARWL